MKTAIVWRAKGATGETVNLRSGPGLSYINKYRIPFGTRIEVVEDLGEWCYVRAGGRDGYMMKEFIMQEGDVNREIKGTLKREVNILGEFGWYSLKADGKVRIRPGQETMFEDIETTKRFLKEAEEAVRLLEAEEQRG